MVTPKLEVGFEILAPEQRIRISRFPSYIRWLHWFNTTMIFLLYATGVQQSFKTLELGQQMVPDSRHWHYWIGSFWVGGLVSLCLLIAVGYRFNQKKSIVSDQLIFKQQVFLIFSLTFIGIMSFTGLGLYGLQESNAPGIRSVLLAIHIMTAVLYIPPLLFHIYLAVVNKNTRESLKTMISDVELEHIIHMPIDGLRCQLSTLNHPLFIQASVLELSLLNFKVKTPKGEWQHLMDPETLTLVDLLHPELQKPVRLPIHFKSEQEHASFLLIEYEYDLPPGESAQRLLRHACFFRRLFLEQRRTPRCRCSIPIQIHLKKGRLDTRTQDLSLGGVGVILSQKLRKQAIHTLAIELYHESYILEGKVVVRKKLGPQQYFHGFSFVRLSPSTQGTIKQYLDEKSYV